MALRLRRGTDAERLLITPLEGELIYTTDTKLLYVGDGATVGGTLVTGSGGSGSSTLDGLTDTNITGALDNQVLTYDEGTDKWIPTTIPGAGQLNLGDLGDVITGDAEFKDVIAFDGVRWTTIRAQDAINPRANLNINVVGDDSTIMVNTTLGVFTGDLVGDVTGDLTGNVDGNIRGVITGLAGSNIVGDTNGTHFGNVTGGNISGVISGSAGSNITGSLTGIVYGSLIGNVVGTLDGDVTGSIFADDSTLMVDGVNSILSNGQIILNTNAIEASIGTLLLGSQNNSLDTIIANSDVLNVIKSGNDGSPNDIASIVLSGSRGSRSVPTTLQTGDYIGNYIISAHDGVDYTPKVIILGQIDTATVDNDLPAKLLFGVSGADGGFNLDNSIDSYGHFGTSVIKYTAFADTDARDAAITSPSPGMTCFVTDGDGAGNPQFQGYTGSGWVTLN